MAIFCDTRGIAHYLNEIIKNAEKEIILVSPYLKFSQPIYELLKERSKSVVCSIIYGKQELKPDTPIKTFSCRFAY